MKLQIAIYDTGKALTLVHRYTKIYTYMEMLVHYMYNIYTVIAWEH